MKEIKSIEKNNDGVKKMKASLDLHDFSVLHNRMDILLRIKEHLPNFKVSLFTIPYDYQAEMSQQKLFRNKALNLVRENLDWMQIIPHGLAHIEREFENCDRWTMKMVLQSIDEMFAKDGLPYEKGFCAPFWLWNQEVIDVLDENGWWGAVDRNQPQMLKTKKFYQYSHSIDEPFSKSNVDVLKLHGHMGAPSSNAIDQCYTEILKLPVDTEWHFVTDFLETT